MKQPTRIPVRDTLNEALAGILQRPTRAGLSILGIAIAVAAFVSVLGLTTTASGQIDNRFSALSATEVTVTDQGDPGLQGPGFPSDSEARVRSIRGVRHAGVFWNAPVGDAAVKVAPQREGETLEVMAASPDLLRAVHAQAQHGVLYDEFHQRRRERVAVVGSAVAARLGLDRLDAQPAIFINDTPFTVIGVVGSVDRQPDILLSVLVPSSVAADLWGQPERGSGAKMLVETDVGAASVVAEQAALAARPDTPDRLEVTAPPDPRALRDSVTTDLNSLFLALAAVALVIGALSIANIMLVAVLERVPEVGLRRAVGAHRREIAAQFLTESMTLGFLGGFAGASIGIVVVVAIAAGKAWTPIVEPWSVWPAPLVGGLTGLLAGLYPAYRASLVEPADALRR